ncbi:hypothetical protein KAR91_62400 [Candidatus Pacearchaeota archaeon]|nr:hypothetical protein [Candidatus Pacearchaeota archaeon]
MKGYITPKEAEVIARLTYEKISVITIAQFDELFNFQPAIRSRLIYRLAKKGILTPIKRGIYIFSPLESGPSGRNINEFLVPSLLFPKGNYYIGYGTMFNYYSFTDQIYQEMNIVNTTRQKKRAIGGLLFKMIKVSPKRMYGFEKIKIKNSEVIVSDKERTLVDMVYYPAPVGGLQKAFEIIKDIIKRKAINRKKFIRYACLFPIASARKRIGFILEESGIKSSELKDLRKSINTKSLIPLCGKSRKGKINKSWGIIEDAA